MTSPSVNIGAHSFSGLSGAAAAIALTPFVDGDLRHACLRSLPAVPSITELLPAGVEVLRSIDDDGRRTWLVVGDGWRASIDTYRAVPSGDIGVFACTAELAEAVAEDFVARCPSPAVPDVIEVQMWHRSDRSPLSRQRPIRTNPWSLTARNYPAGVRDALDRLVRTKPEGEGGRVVLLHGAPGTGKTSAIRSLLWEWRSWADGHVILDGSTFVHDPAYLAEVTTQNAGSDRWVVVVLEDAGDLVDDENPFGGDLSKLLNVSDGIVGMGTQALFVLSTNDQVERVHPALVRPGRCLANIEFTAFSRREAIDWVGEDRDVPAGGLTLAELYERSASTPHITHVAEAAVAGVYL